MNFLDKDRRYLVTGGSGYLGRALIGRLTSMGCTTVRVMARNEGQLIALKERFPHVEIMPGDVADRCSCLKAFRDVDGCFALAAFKHVVMAQGEVRQCVASNVTGSLNALECSLTYKPQFVLGISTDKASRPAAVYGATKFIAEALFAEYEQINPATAYRIVRYGNVWGSTGSFITKWKTKMQAGEEVTLTDPDATRFFWTVGQAVDLIFECLEKATNATPYIPQMKAIRMGTVLDACMEVYGKAPVRITGLRPGENKHETMDGVTFSDQVKQYTKEECIAEFLS